jgi:uncharacterized membrane protein YraQ (UPF0718 family)
VEATTLVLLACLAVATGLACARDPALVVRGLSSSAALFKTVWFELLLGFLLAGLVGTLLPADQVKSWLGTSDARSLAVATAVGLLLPGGPYLLFPAAARLAEQGVSPGALIALVTAKTQASPLRALTYEAPLLGWQLTLARLVPSLLAPFLIGYAGHKLHALLTSFSR